MKEVPRSDVEYAHFSLPLMLRHTLTDLVQFHERFTRFRLYPSLAARGHYEVMRWKSLVLMYLDQWHSFIDHQMSVQKNISRQEHLNLEQIKQPILSDPIDEFLIIKELRNRYHHAGDHIASIVQAGGRTAQYPCIPSLWIRPSWFPRESTRALVNQILDDPGKIPGLFILHHFDFESKSAEIGISLLKAVRRGTPGDGPGVTTGPGS